MGGGARMFFQYGEKEIIYLKQKDKRLAEVIDKIGKSSVKWTAICFLRLFITLSVSRFLQRRRQQSGRECRIILA